MKIVTIVGARPQFVKAAVVSRVIAGRDDMREVIVHTGQHFDPAMSDVFFEEMGIPRPNYFLDIHSLDHGAMTGRMLERIEEVLNAERPECVVVYGDTNSTLAGALAGRKLHVPVAHIEAGLRSFNMDMPEEINRIIADRISNLLCCPTDQAVENLAREGFDAFDCRIERTGDVMYDAALYYGALVGRRANVANTLPSTQDFALCTVHRAENTDDPNRLRSIITALNIVARQVPVVFPMHPRTRNAVAAAGITVDFPAIDPVGYFDMLELLKRCRIVLTDSGGLQKEAFFFAKPCVTLRDETEWVELSACGANKLAGATTEQIVETFREMINAQPDCRPDLYGDGHAGQRIVDALARLCRDE